MRLAHATGTLELDGSLVMGIVNRTPDSFYDGGRMSLDGSVAHAIRLVEEGADLLDLGAVKAGPGEDVPEAEEDARLLPLVAAVADVVDIPISVETARASIARRAVDAGGSIVNDVTGLSDPDLASTCAATGAALVLMHHGGQIRGRPRHPRYSDVVAEVLGTWKELADAAIAAGVSRDQIIVDPGLDFGKNTFHSLELMRRLDELVVCGYPLLVAPSNKDVVGESLDLPLGERVEGTLALVALCAAGDVAFVRVHEVRAAARVVRMIQAVTGKTSPAAPLRGLWD